MTNPVRVLVVDDSALMRKLIPQVLDGDPAIRVVGTAMDGSFALKKIEELKPDVVTLDLEMPRMDGIETLRQLTRQFRLPVIVVSAHSQRGASLTLKALALGAFDFVAKPQEAASGHLQEIGAELAAKIKVAAQAGVQPIWGDWPLENRKARKREPQLLGTPTKVVAIGASTGGPNALQLLLAQLPEDFAGSIVIVQHMPEGFTEMFARRLDETSPVIVKEAQSGDLLLAGRVLICPGNRHLKVRRMGRGDIAVLADDPRVNGHRPSVDVLFRSLVPFGNRGVAVLMSGMGGDGAEGIGAVQAAGGVTIAQSIESCVVDGMPRAAIARGYATHVVPLDALPALLVAQCTPQRDAVLT